MRIRKNTLIILIIIFTVSLVAGVVILLNSSKGNTSTTEKNSISANVKSERGTQIIEITASTGGYSPQQTTAKANIPTTLRIKSQGSYGCERSFVIPSRNISKVLPADGITEIDLGEVQPNKTIRASCSMGMYSFNIKFD